jgi:hypothetical protein
MGSCSTFLSPSRIHCPQLWTLGPMASTITTRPPRPTIEKLHQFQYFWRCPWKHLMWWHQGRQTLQDKAHTRQTGQQIFNPLYPTTDYSPSWRYASLERPPEIQSLQSRKNY